MMDVEAEEQDPPKSKETVVVKSDTSNQAAVPVGGSDKEKRARKDETEGVVDKNSTPRTASIPIQLEDPPEEVSLPPQSAAPTIAGDSKRVSVNVKSMSGSVIHLNENRTPSFPFVTASLPEDAEIMRWGATGPFAFDKKETVVAMNDEALVIKGEGTSSLTSNVLGGQQVEDATNFSKGKQHMKNAAVMSLTSLPATSPGAHLPYLRVMKSDLTCNDVLCGRGGGTNSHEGNRRYRTIVNDRRPEYLCAKKREKAVIAQEIVCFVRQQGGRFLEKKDARGVWVDTGNEKAIKKTLQALREGLDVRKTLMSISTKKLSFQEITSNDVLMGGCPTTTGQHFGNLRYDVLVSSRKKIYSTAERGTKSLIAKRIIEIIQAQGGRFLELKKEDKLKLLALGVPFNDTSSILYENWVKVDFDKAHKKTLRALRERSNNRSEEDEHDGSSGTDAYELITEEEEDNSSSPMKRQTTESNMGSGSKEISLEIAESDCPLRWCDCPICKRMRSRAEMKTKKAPDTTKIRVKRSRGRPLGSKKKTVPTVSPKSDMVV
mmetsp:Transcript_14763/g.21673  ORF Transcript_14763/g.21673 Transcript_14763/m.21673 type:complete len:547 (-) Transcript_14763:2894-4534(-)